MKVTISNTIDLIAAIPALLGFVPHESLMLLAIVSQSDAPPTLRTSMRVDLALAENDPARCITPWAGTLADIPVLAVIGVVVDHSADDEAELPARSTIGTIAEVLRQHGVTSLEIVHLPEFAAGARWRSYTHAEETGALPEPATTTIAVAATVAGFTTAASRAELAARYTLAADTDRDRLRPLIAAAVRRAEDNRTQPTAACERIARADAAVRAVGHGDLPNDDLAIADLVATFATAEFRDAMLGATSSEPRIGAERLALHLWWLAPEPAASHLVAIIAVHAYIQGDGTGARIALDAAGTETLLVRLLTACLDNLIHPAKLGQLMHKASQETRDQLTTEAPHSRT